MAAAEPCIARANGLLTVQLAPDQIVAALSLEFADDLTISQVEAQVIALEQHVRAAHPEVVLLFVKPQTDKTYSDQRRDRFGDPVDGRRKLVRTRGRAKGRSHAR
jgi:divalent metal cation (Fe/Co/Zn/Cd) transporter